MNVLLIIHIFITIALIGVILLQRSEGGGLGLGGGSASSNVFTARGAANFLTRATAILAGLFFINCLIMGMIAKRQIHETSSILGESSPPVAPSTPESQNSTN
jgi:preprotein translocase subunit SecG